MKATNKILPKILLKVSGSIAAYKAAALVSRLHKNNFDVKVVLTENSQKFIGKETFAGLLSSLSMDSEKSTCQGPVVYDQLFTTTSLSKSNDIDLDKLTSKKINFESHLDLNSNSMDHIALDRWADYVIIYPATAHLINKLAAGIADDLASALFLAHDFSKPYVVVPAMNSYMYSHPATQKSIQTLKSWGVDVMSTQHGMLACGEVGWGKALEPEVVYQKIAQYFEEQSSSPVNVSSDLSLSLGAFKSGMTGYLSGQRILITAGGTREPMDDVRYIGNHSSGKTGVGLAQSIKSLGAEVDVLLSNHHEVPEMELMGLSISKFTTFLDLQNLLKEKLSENIYHGVIHAAAVSDYSVEREAGISKISSDQESIYLKLKKNPKLIQQIKDISCYPKTQVIGFKLLVNPSPVEKEQALQKIFSKNVDAVVYNNLSQVLDRQHNFEFYDTKQLVRSGETKQELFKVLGEYLKQKSEPTDLSLT